MTPPESDTPRVEPDWMAIQKAVDDDCPMSIVKQLALNEASWEEAADRIAAYAQAAWDVAVERELAARKWYVVEWISVSERLPEGDGVQVLCWWPIASEPRILSFDGDKWYVPGWEEDGLDLLAPSHWMPLPAAPSATNEEGK